MQTIRRFVSILIVAALSVMPAIAMGARVISDPIAAIATHCGFVTDGGAKVDVPVAMSGANKICSLDISTIAVGSHTITATAVAISPEWGRLESAPSVPFTFVRPSPPSVPTNFRMTP